MRSSFAAQSQDTTGSTEFLSVRTSGQDFALNIMAVREIRGWTTSTPLPDMPHYVRGMINLRGAVLPILDLAARLDLPCSEPKSSSVVVVVEVDGTPMGLLVDEVCDIIAVTAEMRQPVPRIGSTSSTPMVECVITLGDRIVSVIAMDALAPDARMSAAEAA